MRNQVAPSLLLYRPATTASPDRPHYWLVDGAFGEGLWPVLASGTTADVEVLRPEVCGAAPATSTTTMIAAIQAMLLACGQLRLLGAV